MEKERGNEGPVKIFIEDHPLEKDEPNSAAIYMAMDGTFHRVHGVYGQDVLCPDGYKEVTAITARLPGRNAYIRLPYEKK